MLALAAGCKASKKTAGGTATVVRTVTVCAEENVSLKTPVSWVKESGIVLDTAKKSTPVVYQLYSLDQAQLDQLFAEAKTRRAYFPLPEPVGCQLFEMEEAGNRSEALKKKYPNVVSLKGRSPEYKAADARVDYTGKKMKARIKWGSETYFITPVEYGGKTYYIVYNEKDSREQKTPFEQGKKPGNLKPAYDH
jgi:hypothetical protein